MHTQNPAVYYEWQGEITGALPNLYFQIESCHFAVRNFIIRLHYLF